MRYVVFCYNFVSQLRSKLASAKSSKIRSIDPPTEDDNCHGHGCDRADCCIGYGHHLKHGYSGDRKEQLPSQNYAELRHPYNRWRL